jgi:hypothetical protein
MFTKPYQTAINYVVQYAPSLTNPTNFIEWAEEQAQLISFIYDMSYGTVTQDIVEAAKDEQGFEDDSDE